MIEKNWRDLPTDPAWVEAEIQRLGSAVDEFSVAMKARLAEKAREGWRGWDDPSSRDAIYTTLLAHAAGVPLAARQEVDIANFAMMLWRMREGREL